MAVLDIPHTIHVLDCFQEGSYIYRVSDHYYEDNQQRNTRDLEFKNVNSPYFYIHSSVYLDRSTIRQPIYDIPQDIILSWFNEAQINNALVLGCAGCTIPRFLVLQFPTCLVTGIELSSRLISIAQKFFYIDAFQSQFKLLHDDAFAYLKCSSSKQHDLIYVDLFDGKTVPAGVLSADFVHDLIAHMSKNSLVIINLLDVDNDAIRSFQTIVSSQCEYSSLITYDSRQFLILCKGTPSSWNTLKVFLMNKYNVK